MKKAQNKFTLYAVLAVFASLLVLLGVINVLNFTVAAEDADRVTEMIANDQGGFARGTHPAQENAGGFVFDRGGFGPMGPESPEIGKSLRYFTAAIDASGNVTLTAFNISSFDEETAKEWAASLKGRTTGWTSGTYRYRVYDRQGTTMVTVIDQGREMQGVYRTLILSVCGTIAGVLLSFVILKIAGRRLFSPLEQADRRQRKFLSQAEQEFGLPLTVINADVELIERAEGPSDETRSIHRQVRKMNTIVKELGRFAIYSEPQNETALDLSALAEEVLGAYGEKLTENGIELVKTIDRVSINANREVMKGILEELIENALRYAKGSAEFSLSKKGDRVRMVWSNAADLPDGETDQVFDRFTTLENAPEGRNGLGLSYVKQAVEQMDGRARAFVRNHTFTLQIDL